MASTVIHVFGLFMLCYFAALNMIYVTFTVIAWRETTRMMRAESYAGINEAYASPLTPPISVLLPAYNEQASIAESVRALLGLRYPDHEIVVINDGSTDDTLRVLKQEFGLEQIHKALREKITTEHVRAVYASRRHRNLLVIDKTNGGKADALNCGFNAARHPYICAMDADALIDEDALLRVAKPVIDDPERVVATGGIVRIINGCRVEDGRVTDVRLPESRLAALQVIEYIRAFLIGRMGWSRLRSLAIISGAFGLFRSSAVEAAGGFRTDTVGEDIELVVRLHRRMRDAHADYAVKFVPDPVCWTEAPETFRGLGNQRRRWQRGLMETLWRHKRMIGNPRYRTLGMLGLPYFVIFEALGPLIELAGYVILPFAIALGVLSLTYMVTFLCLAVVMGVLLSLAALALEEFKFHRYTRKREIARMMLLAIVENVGYRQLATWYQVRGVFDLLRPRTWGEIPRVGFGETAQSPAPEQGREAMLH